jgi:hypothetical protein
LEKPITDEKAFEAALVAELSKRVVTPEKLAATKAVYDSVASAARALAPKLVPSGDGDIPAFLLHQPRGCPGETWGCTFNIVGDLISRGARFFPDAGAGAINMGLGFLGDPEARQFTILAHEFGHFMQATHRLLPSEALKKCLADPSSGQPQRFQMEEALSDLFAAELLAWRLRSQMAALSTEKRRAAVAQGAVFFCGEPGKRVTDDQHLANDVRTNRIFMAQPYLRSLFGCASRPGEAPKYCDVLALGGIKLEP